MSRAPQPVRSPISRERAEQARRAVAVVFIANGFSFATWAARLPAIRDALELSPGRLGLVLLSLSGASVAMLTVAGPVVRRLGPARTVVVTAVVALTGLAIVGLAPTVWVLAVGLALVGGGVGIWDVAMNVEGADTERHLGRPIMPRYHAGFSLGTVAGAGCGALAAAFDVPVALHLPVVSVVALLAAGLATRSFLPVEPASAAEPGAPAAERPSLLHTWLERRTLLIGVLVFAMAMAEGSANDWLALALVDGYGAEHALAAVGFGVFVTAMTAVRMAGPALLERFDHVAVLRVSALLVLLGTGFVIGGSLLASGDAGPADYAAAAAGAVAWGAGAALGFPMGMSAAATDPQRSAARVGVVSTIGYTAFIAGPPLLGALGQHVGVAKSLVGVSAAVLLALVTAGAVRQPAAAVRRT